MMQFELGNIERLVPERIRRAAWLRPRYPLVSLELRDDAVLATRLVRRKGTYHLAGHGAVQLGAGVFSTSMMRSEVASPEELEQAISSVLTKAGAEGVSRVSVALPDTAARAFVLDFQEMPAGREQAGNLIRWRLKKSVPFPLEQARVSWEELGRREDGRVHLLVTLAPIEALDGIEKVAKQLGLRVGLIDLASFATYNALRLDGQLERQGRGDIALLSATRNYYSLMIFRRGNLIFYRAKNYHVQGGYQGEESLRAVVRELRSSLGYYEEHLLGEGIQRLLLRVVGIDREGILQAARDAGCEAVFPAVVRNVVAEFESAPEEDVPELLPSIGLALRREA